MRGRCARISWWFDDPDDVARQQEPRVFKPSYPINNFDILVSRGFVKNLGACLSAGAGILVVQDSKRTQDR